MSLSVNLLSILFDHFMSSVWDQTSDLLLSWNCSAVYEIRVWSQTRTAVVKIDLMTIIGWFS